MPTRDITETGDFRDSDRCLRTIGLGVVVFLEGESAFVDVDRVGKLCSKS